jgi:hypothetical protein
MALPNSGKQIFAQRTRFLYGNGLRAVAAESGILNGVRANFHRAFIGAFPMAIGIHQPCGKG